MQRLTLEEVKAAALDYYKRGKLTAQQSESSGLRKCFYRIDDCRCAIGAALTDETLDKLAGGMMGCRVDALDNIVQLELSTESEITRIQMAHDAWVQHRDPTGSKFKKLIGLPEEEQQNVSSS